MEKRLKDEFENLLEKAEYSKIIKKIKSIPPEDRDYEINSYMARAGLPVLYPLPVYDRQYSLG